MNIEELKLVLETVSAVSGDAKSVAIWWFIANYGMSFFNIVAVITGLYMVIKLITRAIASAQDWAAYGQACAKAWGGEGDTYSYHRDRKVLNAIIKAAPEGAQRK